MWRWRIACLVLAALVVGSYFAGRSNGVHASEARCEAHHTREAQKAAHAQEKRAREASKISADVGAKHEAERTQIRWRTREIIRVIPTYLPRDDFVPRGFVQLYDAAALGELPEPPSELVGEPSDVPLSEVAEVSALQAEAFHRCRSTVLGWQDWYGRVSALYPPAPPLPVFLGPPGDGLILLR